jgi:protocatechuate 3,4-dioxygenase beta subunit
MDLRRWTLVLCAAAVACLLAFDLLDLRSGSDPAERGRDDPQGARVHDLATPTPSGLRAPEASRSTPSALEVSEVRATSTDHHVEVLDYRNTPVEGVRVYLERDWVDYGSGARTQGWRVLAEGVADADGQVLLRADRESRQETDGFNHRLRIEPPEDRVDLGATWKLWKPGESTTYRLTRMHLVRGHVLDAAGAPVSGATVFLGDMPRGDYVIVNPAWRQTSSGRDGRFEFRNIPTTDDGMVDVWAIGPGASRPASSSEIVNAVEVPLDARGVEVRLR